MTSETGNANMAPMRPTRPWRVALVVAAGAALWGCAADSPDARRPASDATGTVAVAPAEAAGPATSTAPVATIAPVETVAPNGVVVEVQSLDNSFRVQDLTIEAGTEVVFENVGRNEHNIIPEPDSIQGWGVAEVDFAPGAVYSHVFGAPGVYAYVCTIHGVNGKGMVGTITVEPAEPAEPAG